MDLAEADESAPLDEVELERGDAMWFSPLWYQNVSPLVCHPCNWHTLSCPKLQHKALTLRTTDYKIANLNHASKP